MSNFYSNGKLLITGEYTVLDGALALAVPTKYGQSLTVESIPENNIVWKSIDNEHKVWFEDSLPIKEIASGLINPRNDVSKRLVQILHIAKTLNPDFLFRDVGTEAGFKVTTKLDFPQNWGLGSSSTLINNIANWTKVDAYKLLELTFGGSGYDIACAKHDTTITYQLKKAIPVVNQIDFNPTFIDNLYFVYLNKKKNSREGIKEYNKNKHTISSEIEEISSITKNILSCTNIVEFNQLITTHENIISSIIKQPTIKKSLFKDFDGVIKSLGAWGGDFILVSSNFNPSNYFKDKGYPIIIAYKNMVLN